jgi:D-alanine-D-alanine ligase
VKKIKLGVIFGGRSGEHEVSLVSAASIVEALDKSRFDIVPVGISKEGRWYVGEGVMDFLKSGRADGEIHPAVLLPDAEGGLITWAEGKEAIKLDAAFPVLHGPYGEDGTVQGLLELSDLPYVGCGVLASSLAMDKIISKEIFEARGLPTVKYIWFLKSIWEKEKKSLVEKIEAKLKYPMFVKPANLGSSVGIYKVKDRGELTGTIPLSMEYDRKILIEESVPDAREIEVSVLGNDDPIASVPGEIIPSGEFYDYDAKYVDGKSTDEIPAKLPGDVSEKIRETAVSAFSAIDGSGMARVDFLVNGKTNEVFLNELNTIPGFTSISMYPKLMEASGVPYSELLSRLVDLAFERHRVKRSLKTSYQPKEDWFK